MDVDDWGDRQCSTSRLRICRESKSFMYMSTPGSMRLREVTSSFATELGVPLLSYSAEAPALSAKDRHPLVYRVNPPLTRKLEATGRESFGGVGAGTGLWKRRESYG